MSSKARLRAIVAVAAAAAVALTIGVTLLTAGGPDRPTLARTAAQERRPSPRLTLDLGVRSDAEAVALRRAERLYEAGERRAAARLFARYSSLEARVGAAVASWPRGTLARLRRLARERPRSALVRLHLGLTLFALGHDREALAAWRAAARVQPDSLSAIRAGDLLHPRSPPGLPVFVPSARFPRALAQLSPAARLAALRRAARRGGVRARLLYGVALQRLGRRLSARRQYEFAARRAPGNAEAQVAAAVGRFDKDRPARAFSRLGPLVRKFPRAPTVRFHLGLLLFWLGRLDEGRRQLALARAQAPSSPLGREAARFLAALQSAGRG